MSPEEKDADRKATRERVQCFREEKKEAARKAREAVHAMALVPLRVQNDLWFHEMRQPVTLPEQLPGEQVSPCRCGSLSRIALTDPVSAGR